MKDRQYNGQNKKINYDLQHTKRKTEDWTTWTSLKIGGEHMCSGRVGSSAPLVTPVVLL
jgi:hypothetical protein